MVMVLVALAAPAPAAARGKAKAVRAAKPPAKAAPSDPKAVEALGKAFTAYRDGDHAEAAKLAAPLVKAKLRNADYALYVAAQSSFLAGDRAAALPLFRTLAKTAGSRFRSAAAWRVADCLFETGKLADAAAAYQKLLRGGGDGDPAIALHRIAAAQNAGAAGGGKNNAAGGGKNKKTGKLAQATWRRLALEYPAHPLAAAAIASLEAAGAPPLTAAERIARAERMTRDRAWDAALAELALVEDDEPEATRDLRDYWIGTTYFRMRRRYQRAGELLVRVHGKLPGRAAEALFHGARAYSRADRDDDAITWYAEVVRKYPDSSYASEAQFLIGWLDFNRGKYRESIPGLTAVLDDYGGSQWADDARWYLAFSHYLLGEYDQALPHLEKIAARGGALEGGKGRYWQARTLAALGRADEATAELEEIVADYPFSWYAQLARARLAESGKTVDPFGSRKAGPSGGKKRSSGPELGEIDDALAADPLIARAQELIAAGMTIEAGDELRRGETAFLKKYGRGRALPILLDRYRQAGNFNRPWMLAVSYGGSALDRDPKGDARRWWEYALPLAYREHIEKWRELGENPPYYLYTIMRKESGYNPHDVSYADAIGLLQMIPPTTRRVAPQLGLEYTDDLLYDPELNVRVGSWYIGSLLQKFKMQIPIGAGSFNCGPRPVMKWLDKFGDRPVDEFVELVAYTQTREYMKKVADIYARYLYLYEGVDHQQPLTVDRSYVKNDLDY